MEMGKLRQPDVRNSVDANSANWNRECLHQMQSTQYATCSKTFARKPCCVMTLLMAVYCSQTFPNYIDARNSIENGM